MMERRSRLEITRRAALAGLALLTPPAWAARPLTVFAAASLKPALDEIAAAWDAPVALSYGGSGTMARQATAGAPADVLILAARDWMEWVEGQGALVGDPVSVASNRLVLAGPKDSAPLGFDQDAIIARLGPGGRLAMADPMTAPAGRYAREALETLGLWDVLGPRALLAENVRAALAYLARGDVELGFVYRSDTVGTGVALLAEAPAESHSRIEYPAAVLRGAGPEADTFLAHVAAAGPVFARHGFQPA
jgi:molybdate transport system substrate-binding protein